MRAVTDLAKISYCARRRIARMKQLLSTCPRSDGIKRNAVVTWAVVELDNLIINLHREFTVSCLMTCRTASGQRVSHVAGTLSQLEAARYIMRTLEPRKFRERFQTGVIPRREEAVLRDPARVMQVSVAAGLSNLTSVTNALSLNSPAFGEISKVRHFFAHRNLDTAEKAIALGLSRGLQRPLEAWMIVDQLLPNKPYTLLEEWLADISNFHSLLTA
jgi:hypothetical protein